MHPRYSTIFGIENLELNQHFRVVEPDDHVSEHEQKERGAQTNPILELSPQLFQDLQRAFAPLEITKIIQSEQLAWQDGMLFLPQSSLSTADKRTLWQLMSNHLDNL
ncbi:MAG: hypothetical protein ACTJH9_06510 [Pseudoalteromonas sp.]|uniref:hypothetical protein n=1 Tax=unclassified Pseudoalteromonas TaxID=194690 RepID=UPI003F9A23C6